jgi:5-methylcytosine-specific restriction endonuclease McrA
MDWTKAVTLMLGGKADPIVESEYIIRSPSVQVFMPSVIVLRYSIPTHRRRINMAKRRAIFETHKWTCCYCGLKAKGVVGRGIMTIDHVLPRAQGGSNDPINMVVACKPCNTKKADQTPEQARMRMLYPAREPQWDERFALSFTGRDGKLPEAWVSFLPTT